MKFIRNGKRYRSHPVLWLEFASCAEARLRMDEKVIDRQSAAVQQDHNVNDQVEITRRVDGVDKQNERDNEHQVICKEAEQLPKGILPNRAIQTIQEVKGVTQKDTAEDHR